jgi:hypothetical protein
MDATLGSSSSAAAASTTTKPALTRNLSGVRGGAARAHRKKRNPHRRLRHLRLSPRPTTHNCKPSILIPS